MKVTITARKFKARDTLKEYIEGEVDSLTKYYDDILDVEVILSFQNSLNSVKQAEILVKVPGQNLTAKEESDEFEKSVKSAVEKISRQLQKLKEKRISHASIPKIERLTDQS